MPRRFREKEVRKTEIVMGGLREERSGEREREREREKERERDRERQRVDNGEQLQQIGDVGDYC